jgi:hypothetical protein
MATMSAHLFFRLVYRFLYLLLNLLLLTLLVAAPGDMIRQALNSGQSYLILVIAICYFLTIAVVAFVYAMRLYISRSVLASIPKSWIPIEKSDVGEDVHGMIDESLSRSAAIAFHARPRLGVHLAAADGAGGPVDEGEVEEQTRRRKKAKKRAEATVALPRLKPVWGNIEHPGWASPESPDLPNLQYSTILSELPNLIEAKALTLAPPDINSSSNPPALDAEAVALLQRTEEMDLRKFLAHLVELECLEPSHDTARFIELYEYARFSTNALSNTQFRELMHLFAEVLRQMKPLTTENLQTFFDEQDGADGASLVRTVDTDIDEDAPIGTDPTTPRSQRSKASLRSQASMQSAAPSSDSGSVKRTSRQPQRPSLLGPKSSTGTGAATWQYRTAPTTPKSRRTARSRASSANSFAQTRQPYAISSQPSSASLRSGESQGSVIVRPSRHADGEELGLADNG